jgi:hypothetical protein
MYTDISCNSLVNIGWINLFKCWDLDYLTELFSKLARIVTLHFLDLYPYFMRFEILDFKQWVLNVACKSLCNTTLNSVSTTYKQWNQCRCVNWATIFLHRRSWLFNWWSAWPLSFWIYLSIKWMSNINELFLWIKWWPVDLLHIRYFNYLAWDCSQIVEVD